jgi:hypothetical protein
LTFDGFVNRLREAVNELRRRGWGLREEHFEGLLAQAKGVVEMMEAAQRPRPDPDPWSAYEAAAPAGFWDDL